VTLRSRFFHAIKQQEQIIIPESQNIKTEPVISPLLSASDSHVATGDGEFFMMWQEEFPLSLPRAESVLNSKTPTILVQAYLIPEYVTDDLLGSIAQDGCYMNGGQLVQVYARVN
jgi:hypothetical protein